jgi:hippurate hydrolase
MAGAIGDLFNGKIEVTIDAGYPPVINTRREAAVALRAARHVVGPSGLVSLDHPSMGSEDFSYYLQAIPGCYVRFGARRKEDEYIPLHSPAFDINEEVLKVGAAFFDAVVREAIAEYGSVR